MFTVGFYKKAMVVSTNGVETIEKENIQELRRLVIQVFRNPSGKLVIDLNKVNHIDDEAFNILERLYNLAEKKNVLVEFANINSNLFKELKEKADHKDFKITKYIHLDSSGGKKENVA